MSELVKLMSVNGVVMYVREDAVDNVVNAGFGIKSEGAKPQKGDAQTAEKPIYQMNKEELQAYADENGIEYAEDATKAELLEVIKGE